MVGLQSFKQLSPERLVAIFKGVGVLEFQLGYMENGMDANVLGRSRVKDM